MSLPRVSLCILFLSLKLPSLSASQLLPHLSRQLVQGVCQNMLSCICSICELDLIDCNSYYLPVVGVLYFVLWHSLLYSPKIKILRKKLRYIFFLSILFKYFLCLKIRIDDVNCLRLPVSAGKKHYFSDSHLQGQPSKMRKWEDTRALCLVHHHHENPLLQYNENPLFSCVFLLKKEDNKWVMSWLVSGSEDLLCILWDVLLPWHRALSWPRLR